MSLARSFPYSIYSADRFHELSYQCTKADHQVALIESPFLDAILVPCGGHLEGRCATNRYFQLLGNIHDIESYFGVDNVLGLYVHIFLCHWGHNAIIFTWVSANLFHIGWCANYELWMHNPIKTICLAHPICDPHFGSSDVTSEAAYSGIYHLLYTLGFLSASKHLYNLVIACELVAVISLLVALIHLIYVDSFLASSTNILHHQYLCACIDKLEQRLPRGTVGILIGTLSIGWCAHLVCLSVPVSRGMPALRALATDPFYTGNWVSYMGRGVKIQDKDNHIFGSRYGAGESVLTFVGGLKPDTLSIYLSDIAHHHLAAGILFVLLTHLYLSLYKGLGHRSFPCSFLIHDLILSSSLHLQLSLACAGLGTLTSAVAQHLYSLGPYVYLSYDYVTTLALYLHHQYIASFLVMAALIHGGIFLICDYTNPTMLVSCRRHLDFNVALHLPEGRIPTFLLALLKMKDQLSSHLSYICLFLGFHILALYIHNDTVVAFREQEKHILIEPVHGYQSINSSFLATMPLGPGDVLAHHAIALGLHVTALILLKGASSGRGSKLMPDKINFAVSFACDGPTRGGTCDISAWDSYYLAFFWMLNTDAWLMFYFHWKHMTVWQNASLQFDESSTYLNGWFRDYLWFYSGSLVNGYNAFGANDLAVLAWLFLGAHLTWATGFMFLISWRGYWQELIDIILVMHLKTPILYDLWNGGIYTPVALSIVQARFIGLIHFSVGFIFTYAAFVVGATS
jgi:photosystem I P700 chlorophyll a apoprotein A2